jgi:hypothetical protein
MKKVSKVKIKLKVALSSLALSTRLSYDVFFFTKTQLLAPPVYLLTPQSACFCPKSFFSFVELQ